MLNTESYHVYPHLAIYFGSPFGRYPTFLTSVGRQKAFQQAYNMVPLFRAVVKFCSTNRFFTIFLIKKTYFYDSNKIKQRVEKSYIIRDFLLMM